jgi:hypothetical protein
MIDRNSTFFRLSKEIAADFLQSTVIVDDYGASGFYSSRDVSLLEPERHRRPPIGVKASLAQPDVLSTEEAENVAPETDYRSDHYFNEKVIVRAFAKKGVVCSVIKPAKAEMDSLTELIRDLADCADITVLDWSLYDDKGNKALEIIANVLSQDRERLTGRLRLLAIYTGNNAPDRIAPTIKEHLEEELPNSVEMDANGFALNCGATRIVILLKPERDKISQQFHERIVEFDNLAESLIEEFTQMTAGLVSNVLVNSLAHLRKNTFKMLGRFAGDLDAPFLTHRVLQDNVPEDAEEDLVMLISREIEAILEEVGSGRCAGIEAIKAWLVLNGIESFDLGRNKPFTRDQFAEACISGITVFDGLSNSEQRNLHQKITRQLNPAAQERLLDEKFAQLTVMRSFYENKLPTLTLGSVVKMTKDDEAGGSPYWVCLLPRCDTVRLDEPRAFLFLPLLMDQNQFNWVLREGDSYTRLRVESKPYNLRVFTFRPVEHRMILAKKESGDYFFHDVNDIQFKWLGELRGDHALRLSGSFAATMSRIGLSESKWLERSAK